MTTNNMFSFQDKQAILKFVRSVIKSRLDGTEKPELAAKIPGIKNPGACFVTLHTADNMLRGCIGNIAATENLGANLEHNAVNAAFLDPRFPAVASVDELNTLKIEVSVLTPMRDISSADEFIPGQHGIVLMLHGRSAVFLPQVAPEQGWDRETTLRHLSMKAGLPSDAWQNASARFRVFEALVFAEDK
ncbi:MAG: AmmeMemoRadiSam system protein A [Victivallales bacterium]|nr:AmmeMemoRadiSam system protein A [Victivallales bacterium]